MPSTSPAQHNYMEMCAHNPQHAKGKCPSPVVAQEFVSADKAKGISGVIHTLARKRAGLTT